jgi:hypothetical protein
MSTLVIIPMQITAALPVVTSSKSENARPTLIRVQNYYIALNIAAVIRSVYR